MVRPTGRTMSRRLASAFLVAALLCFANASSQQKPCAAEAGCHGACGDKYHHKASEFPFTVEVAKEARTFTTAFDFKVCAKECDAGSAYCQALKSFFVRLDSTIVDTPRFIRSISDSTPVAECGERGKGYHFAGQQLGSLHQAAPNSGACQTFSIEVFNPTGSNKALELADVCAQGVKVVDASGADVFNQGSKSCLFLLELEDGKSGVTELLDAHALPQPKTALTAQPGMLEAVTNQRRRLLQASSSPQPYAYNSPKLAPVYASPKPAYSPYAYSSPSAPKYSPKAAPVVASPKLAPVYASPKPAYSPYAYSSPPAPKYSPKAAPVVASPKLAPIYASPKPAYSPYAYSSPSAPKYSPKAAPAVASPKLAPVYASPKPAYSPYAYFSPSAPKYSPKAAPVVASPKLAPVYASPKPAYSPYAYSSPSAPKAAPAVASPKLAPVVASPKPYLTPSPYAYYASPTPAPYYYRATAAEVSRFERPSGRSLLSIPSMFNRRQLA